MSAETRGAERLKSEIQALLAQVQTLRDEIRLELHLASMEARDAWTKLEPDVDALAATARQATLASREAIAEALVRFRAFREEVRAQARERARG